MKIIKKFLSLFKIAQKPLKLSNLPDSFYIGQPYVEDPNKIDCFIEVHFLFPASIDKIEFYLHNTKVSLEQTGSILKIRFAKKLSKKLWLNVNKSHSGEDFILSYVARLMPEINRRLLENRYIKGHLLSRTFSTLDTVGIFLIYKNKHVRLRWPGSISNFPPSETLAREKDQIYIRDYIDAIYSYFKNDYDDCLRRVITSVENLFKVRNLKGKDDNQKSFKSILYNNLDIQIFSNKIIADNIVFIYKLRNKIVHDKFRVKLSNGRVCKKAIGSLNYLLQRLSGDDAIGIYVSSLAIQFLMLQNFVGEGHTLDDIEKFDRNAPVDPSHIINTPEEFDNWMFSSLQITNKEKSIIFRN